MKKIIFALMMCFVLIFFNGCFIDKEIEEEGEFNNFTGWVNIEFNPPIELKAGHYYEVDYFNNTIREIN